MRTVAEAMLDRAVGWRQGVVARVSAVPLTLADVPVPGFAAVPEPFVTGGTSGGAGPGARQAAIAEALERHAAACCPLESVVPAATDLRWPLGSFTLHSARQRSSPGFRYAAGYRDVRYARAWTLPDNQPVWVPAGLVGLAATHGLPATSSGLAAGSSPARALLRATQELVERDAFTVTWLHGLPARQVPLPAELSTPVAELGGRVTAFDLTPAYSPHPVAAVAGTLPLAGRQRPTLGLACRASWADAVHKAWLEWCQGTVFVSVWLANNPDRRLTPAQVTDFDTHAAYYAGHPDDWHRLPLWSGQITRPSPDSPSQGPAAQLTELVSTLHGNGVRLAYRELTTPEPRAVGLHVMRVLSPDLTPLHADHRWPHLGGRTADVRWRYPWAPARSSFPSAHPHPLG
ncbi:YcaO-like family protein [Actinophytocola sp. KF-1]